MKGEGGGGEWGERQKKWQGRRLTHMAPVATLLPAATGSSSINWQDIFHCTIISTRVRAKPHHHRYHQQGPSTHDWICLNEQKKKTFCSGVNYYWNVSCTNTHIYIKNPLQQTSLLSSLLGSAHAFLVSPLWTVWTSGPHHYSALFCSTILFYRPYRQLQATK